MTDSLPGDSFAVVNGASLRSTNEIRVKKAWSEKNIV